MLPPEFLSQMGKLLKEYSTGDALQILDDSGKILARMIREEEMNVVLSDLARDDPQFMFRCYLAYHVSHTNGHLSDEDMLPILRYPHQVDFEVVFRVRAVMVVLHELSIQGRPGPQGEIFSRLKTGGFNHPCGGH